MQVIIPPHHVPSKLYASCMPLSNHKLVAMSFSMQVGYFYNSYSSGQAGPCFLHQVCSNQLGLCFLKQVVLVKLDLASLCRFTTWHLLASPKISIFYLRKTWLPSLHFQPTSCMHCLIAVATFVLLHSLHELLLASPVAVPTQSTWVLPVYAPTQCLRPLSWYLYFPDLHPLSQVLSSYHSTLLVVLDFPNLHLLQQVVMSAYMIFLIATWTYRP